MQEIRITDIKDHRVEIYTRLNDKQVKRYNEPGIGYFICESEKVIRRALQAGYPAESFFVEENKYQLVSEWDGVGRDVPCFVSDVTLMRQITGYALTGGILAVMRRKPLLQEEEILSKSRYVVLLDDIENPTNVGAIFRSAAALGADAILLTEGCADPLYRRAARVSMGSVFVLDWTFSSASVIKKIKDGGFCLTALALSDHARELGRDVSPFREKTVLALGNEEYGVSDTILEACDHIVKIPMKKGVDSLNVAAAGAVAFWAFFNNQ